MVDVDRLNEDIGLLTGSLDAPRLTPSQILAIGSLLKTGRLVAAGQPLWWCEIHGSSASIFSEQCDTGAFLSADAEGKGFDVDEDDCVMVEGWWMPTGKDET